MNNNSKSVRATLLVLAQQIKTLVAEKKTVCATRRSQLKAIKEEKTAALANYVKGTVTKKSIRKTATDNAKAIRSQAN